MPKNSETMIATFAEHTGILAQHDDQILASKNT